MSFAVRSITVEEAEPLYPQFIELLIDSVEGGASVGFVQPLELEEVEAYWKEIIPGISVDSMALVVGFSADGHVAGAVQLARCPKSNGRHRAEVHKLFVHSRFRGQRLGSMLMDAVEQKAREWGLTLLVLDTATGEVAEAMYQRRGYVKIGEIPDYAMNPDGQTHATSFFYRQL